MPLIHRRTALTLLAAASIFRPQLGLSFPGKARERNPLFDELLNDYLKRRTKFTSAVLALAADVRQQGNEADALGLEKLAEPPSETSLQIDDLPETVLPAANVGWKRQLRSLEEAYSQDLIRQGDNARVKGQMSLAWWLVREAAYRYPDQPRARALLGYVQYEGKWMTPFRKQMLKEGNVWTDDFGWLKADDVAKYKEGMRRYEGRWVDKDKEAAFRADFRKAWVIESEHFRVMSNYSQERAVAISVDLERFHRFFIRAYAPVFMNPAQMRALFEGTSPSSGVVKKHVVHYYRNRKEFVAALTAAGQADAAISNGMYIPGRNQNRSYFYHDNDADRTDGTFYHETTHQILAESATRPVGDDGWVDGDFWIVEGLACYMESFEPGPGGGTVGDPRHTRINWARKYLVEQDFFVPLATFTAMTKRDFQCEHLMGPERVARLQRYYAQGAAVCHFLLHSGQGKYREAFIKYVAQAYCADQRVRKNNQTLAELTGVDFQALDAEYREYVRNLPAK